MVLYSTCMPRVMMTWRDSFGKFAQVLIVGRSTGGGGASVFPSDDAGAAAACHHRNGDRMPPHVLILRQAVEAPFGLAPCGREWPVAPTHLLGVSSSTYANPPPSKGAKSVDPMPKKKKNRAAQEERVRRELLLERRPTVEECSG